MPSILFVCFANRFRSPLAAAFYQQRLEPIPDGKDWLVSSAGTWTSQGLPADPRAIQDAIFWGVDIRAHRSRQVDDAILSQNDLILVMESGQKEALQVEFPRHLSRVFLLTEVAGGSQYDITDPFSPQNIPHQEIARELYELIDHGFHKIYNLALDSHNIFHLPNLS